MDPECTHIDTADRQPRLIFRQKFSFKGAYWSRAISLKSGGYLASVEGKPILQVTVLYNFTEITITTPPLTRILDRLIGGGIILCGDVV
jgi:hypothetical protein